MIITRSPLRVSFTGGGTDIPAFYKNYGPGVVVSTAINRYVYVTLNEKFDGKVSVRYRVHELVDSVEELRHPLIRECLLHFGIKNGIEIVIASEVPARGSGLGASSALACALIKALKVYTGEKEWDINRMKLAELAAKIEIQNVGSPIGKQDHYASAFGGLNKLTFNSDDTVEVIAYGSDEFTKELEEQSMLFYLDIEHQYYVETGNRDRSFVQTILRDQNREIPAKHKIHQLQRDNAVQMWEHMEYANIERFQDHVNENWRLKRTVHDNISSPIIDAIILQALHAGAVAAKVCGAGGGGFLYLIVPPSMQDSVISELSDLHELKFGFDLEGTKCIFEDRKNYARNFS